MYLYSFYMVMYKKRMTYVLKHAFIVKLIMLFNFLLTYFCSHINQILFLYHPSFDWTTVSPRPVCVRGRKLFCERWTMHLIKKKKNRSWISLKCNLPSPEPPFWKWQTSSRLLFFLGLVWRIMWIQLLHTNVTWNNAAPNSMMKSGDLTSTFF